MTFLAIEEIFLDVADLEKSLAFYRDLLGISVDKSTPERVYLQLETGHVVLQVKGGSGRHRGGGPMHFAFTVSEERFDEIAARVNDGQTFIRGPMGGPAGKAGRALFMIDPDGNEAEVNTRYLFGKPIRS